MSDIFISYRRQDVAGHVGRLYDALVSRYGPDRVIFDIEDLAPGQDFASQLHQAVAACKSVLVVIGPQWLTATDADGERRIDDPGDFIRTQIAAALRSGKHVVPILVDGVAMPRPADLPQDLQGITRLNALQLRHATWDQDLLGLYYALDRLLSLDAVASPMLGTTTSLPAARAPFLSRILAAFEVLTGKAGAEEKNRPAVTSPQPHPRQPSAPPAAGTAGGGRTRDARPVAAGKQVFVSYAEEDRPLADDVVRFLEGRGHACWVAHRNIPAGTRSWAGPIVAAIANSRVVVILVTNYSVASKQVLREITVADDENIPLIPVCMDNVPLSEDFRYFFSSAQRLELEATSREQTVQTIGAAVERHLTSA